MKFYNKTSILNAYKLIILLLILVFLFTSNCFAYTTTPKISIGNINSLFLKDDGVVWSTRRDIAYPEIIKNSLYKLEENVKDFSSSIYHTSFLKNDGTVWSFGRNEYGELGDGNTLPWNDVVRAPVKAIGIENAIQVIALKSNTIFLKSDGTVWKCGRQGTTTPKQITEIKDVKFIAAYDENHETTSEGIYYPPTMFFLKTDNTVWTMKMTSTTPQYVMSNVSQVSSKTSYNYVYEFHALFLKTDGSVWAYGNNEFGQLGDGTITKRPNPVKVMADVKYIHAGTSCSFFIKTDGSVWACGKNDNYQLGDNANTHKYIPYEIKGLTDVIQIVSDSSLGTTLFLKDNGEVWGCGDNRHNQLLNANNPQITPVLITLLTDPPELSISTAFNDIGDNTDLEINISGKNIKKLCTINVIDTENNNIMYSQNIENLNYNEASSELNDNIVVPLNNAPEKDYNLEVRIINKKNSVLGTSNKIKINKNNVLNKILGRAMIGEKNSRIILFDDMGRHYDDNESNRNLVKQIKEKALGIYLITNNVDPVLYPLLEAN